MKGGGRGGRSGVRIRGGGAGMQMRGGGRSGGIGVQAR